MGPVEAFALGFTVAGALALGGVILNQWAAARHPRPRRISVRPTNGLEDGGVVVFVYHRKAKVQLQFPMDVSMPYAIDATLAAWLQAMRAVQ